jgi:hypothetical protein
MVSGPAMRVVAAGAKVVAESRTKDKLFVASITPASLYFYGNRNKIK